MEEVLSKKQVEFITHSTKKINLAHGAVRCGKTLGTLFRCMQAVDECPDSQIWFIGHTSSTIYDNAISLIINPQPYGKPDPLSIFRPYCNWLKGNRQLLYKDKTINTVGAKDAGAIGAIQGKTMSICYCDEMTLYPDNVINMISTRISLPHSLLIATMNPSSPSHILKTWIDKAESGDQNYYALKFLLDDNPFVEESYKLRLKNSLSGVFYKRNYLGEWCLAEGSIFDFFDRSIYVIKKPQRTADYWIVGIDYGTNNAFAAVLVGVSTGQYVQEGATWWVEDEYYWDSKATLYQKTSSEFAEDIKQWLQPYDVRSIYLDPSAATFRVDLQRKGMHPVNANNDVHEGIMRMISEMKSGRLLVLDKCKNLIREMEGYVWDPKKAERGEDEPLKKNDHALDALRYAVNSHKIPKVPTAQERMEQQAQYYQQQRQIMNGARSPRELGFR